MTLSEEQKETIYQKKTFFSKKLQQNYRLEGKYLFILDYKKYSQGFYYG